VHQVHIQTGVVTVNGHDDAIDVDQGRCPDKLILRTPGRHDRGVKAKYLINLKFPIGNSFAG